MMRCLVVTSLVLAAGAAHAQDTQHLSLAEAESLALRQSTALAMTRTVIDSAEERVAAARASRLPRVSLEANALVWDKELSFLFAIPGMMLPPGVEPEAITVRSRVTASASLTVAQPITPQIALGHVIALEKAGVAAARHEHRQSELDIAHRAADGYLLVLLASSAGDIAEQRAAQVQIQLERVAALVEGGVLQPVDALRLRAALAAAQQDVIRSRSQAALAASALAVILGLPQGQSVAVSDSLPAEPGPPPTSVADALRRAQSDRPELAALAQRTLQAERGASAARAQLVPSLSAVGQVQHNQGGGTFQAANSWFVGLMLQWDVWDWGQRQHSYKEAALRAEQARLGARLLHDQLRVEVEGAVRDAASAYETLAVARTGLEAAEEAARIQTALYEEGAATTTDLLGAQAEVTQARLSYAAARYAYFRALAALARATGQLPTALLMMTTI